MSSRAIILAALVLGAGLGLVARFSIEGDGDTREPSAEDVGEWLVDYGVELAPTQAQSRLLRWNAPDACVPVYRVRVDERMPDHVARFFNRSAEHSELWLALAAHENPDAGRDALGLRVTRGRAVLQSDDAGVKPYDETAPLAVSSRRDFYVSGLGLGPSAPDAACRNRSWDPLEDALALGWPWFPAHRVAPGERWAGAPVEARCNETACLTADGMAGVRAHERVCATPAWRETFVDELTAGDQAFVALDSSWRDREDLDQIEGGTTTSRQVVFSPDHGRLAWARVEVLHRWSQVQREIVIESVDACPGSLRAAGWAAPPDVVERAERTARSAEIDSTKPDTEASPAAAR